MAIASIDDTFRARSDERFLLPMSVARPNRVLGFLGACLIYAAVLTPVVVEDFGRSAPAPEAQEIPVEIVIQPPQENPPEEKLPDPVAPKPDLKPLDEKPAFDAPRAGNNEKVDDDDADKLAKSSVTAEAKALEPKPDSAPNAAAAPENEPQPKPSAPENAPPVDAAQSPTGELAAEKPTQPQQQAKLEPQKDTHAAAGGEKFPTFASVPDVDFGAMAKVAPIGGGRGKATYLSIVFGMIAARAPTIRGKTSRSGEITFSVDSMGGLIERTIVVSSGSHERDAEAYEAIRKAAPFPPPPNHGSIGLILTY
jgi:TonB family protein